MTFEQKPEGGKRFSHTTTSIWRMSTPGRRQSKCKVIRFQGRSMPGMFKKSGCSRVSTGEKRRVVQMIQD